MWFASTDRPRPNPIAGSGGHASLPALVRKLVQYREHGAGEVALLQRLLGARVQRARAGVALVAEGEAPSDLHVVLSGWASRTCAAPRGKRQIVAFHLPGDIVDFNIFLMRRMDSTVTALSDLRVASISRSMLAQLTETAPRLAQSFWWDALNSASIQRAWMTRLGLGGARERICGMLCELVTRLHAVGLVQEESCTLPLRQADLANACGLTAEHANRTLRELRAERLFTLESGLLRILDWHGLSAIAGFDPAYLHFREVEGDPADTPASADAFAMTFPAGPAATG